MRPATFHGLLLLAVAVGAGAAGYLLGRSGSAARIRELEAETLRQAGDSRELETRLREAETRAATPLRAAGESPAVAAAPPSGGGAAATVPAPEAGPTPEQRLRRVREIEGAADGWFERGEGQAALAALLELAALVPEGREAAMSLAVRINEDVSGEGKLKLSQMVYYTSLADAGVKSLMLWALENDSPAGFREMTAYSLPWTLPPEETIGRFTKALGGERETGVRRALIWNLARMRNPEADAALLTILRDPAREASLRSFVATEIMESANPEVRRTIEDLAVTERDPEVRAAAATALRILNPPATGFLVTGTLPDSQAAAAGMEAGDILVSYGGRPVKNLEEVRAAAGETANQPDVEIVVVRGDRQVTLRLRPGRMGVFGRDVTAK